MAAAQFCAHGEHMVKFMAGKVVSLVGRKLYHQSNRVTGPKIVDPSGNSSILRSGQSQQFFKVLMNLMPLTEQNPHGVAPNRKDWSNHCTTSIALHWFFNCSTGFSDPNHWLFDTV